MCTTLTLLQVGFNPHVHSTHIIGDIYQPSEALNWPWLGEITLTSVYKSTKKEDSDLV